MRLYTDSPRSTPSRTAAQLIVVAARSESFPLFGFDLADKLFEEKLDLLVRLLREQP